jgi:fumarylacetoacetase
MTVDQPQALNATHDPALRSWVTSANRANTDFPIQNLPFAVFRRRDTDATFRGGVAIGDQVLDLRSLQARERLTGAVGAALEACGEPTLNRFMGSGAAAASCLRAWLSAALRSDAPLAPRLAADLVPQAAVEFALPAAIGDYTDFYASIHHARTVGAQFRPENPLLPNYRWMPIAYHGRSSSIGVSDQSLRRPAGQSLPMGTSVPCLGPTRRLDFELEIGAFIGAGNPRGEAIPIERAEQHLFGLCLLNDWSARDLQGWEYQPLGPFLGKNFATTISPWIVTQEALAPFRLPFARPPEDPQPLGYLDAPAVRGSGAFDVQVEAAIETASMRARGIAPHRLCDSNLCHTYWTVGQMITHHTINGCNLRPGDLLGTGTLSGPRPEQAGSLLELTDGGRRALELPSGEARRWIEDGDRIILRARCERTGWTRIGFGSATGIVLPAGDALTGSG